MDKHFCSLGGHEWVHIEQITSSPGGKYIIDECPFPRETDCREHAPEGPFAQSEQERAKQEFVETLAQGIGIL